MKALLVLGGLMALFVLGSAAETTGALVVGTVAAPIAGVASIVAVKDVPADMLKLYQEAAKTCPGMDWTLLAGVGKTETNHGRSTLPGVHSGANFAGAMGPMQFLRATWDAFHLPSLPNDPYDPRAAVFAAAHYLCSNGGGGGTEARVRQALWAYNPSTAYVNKVLGWAHQYAVDATHVVQQIVSAASKPGDPFGGACRPVKTQGFGPTSFPGEPFVNGVRTHTGFDLACAGGTPVHSVTDGVAHVTVGCVAGIFSCGGGWGNNVVVEIVMALPGDSTQHRYFVRYAHLQAVAIRDGAQVRGGQLLGLEGTTGYSTGPHLHFEVDRDAAAVSHAVNPQPLLEVR